MEKHNLTFYPTVNDLQNHIHQAIKDIAEGTLTSTVSRKIIQFGHFIYFFSNINGLQWLVCHNACT